jgi:hypothetical protein
MEESLLALKSSKPTNKVDAISYKKIAAILTSINNKNFSSLSILLKSSDPDVRTRALAVLDEIAVGSPTSRNNDENWDWDMYMRQSHIEGSAHSPSYLARNLFDATLMQSILNAANDSEARVRAACMFALAVITPADSEITNVVKNRLVSDPDKTVKLRCVETLGRYAAKQRNQASEIGKMMQTATQHDPDCAVRLGAAIVLQMIHSELENNTKDASRTVILAQEFGMMTGVAIKDHIGTNKIPCRKGVEYGVCVVPDDSDKAPDLKVRLTAPFARSNWPDNRVRSGRHIDVSPDRRAAIYSMQSPCGNFSEVTWMVADDDRPGDYKAEVLVNNKVSKTFDFEIVASK